MAPKDFSAAWVKLRGQNITQGQIGSATMISSRLKVNGEDFNHEVIWPCLYDRDLNSE